HATDQFVFPPRQRLLRERLRYQRPQPTVDRFVHAEHHAVTQHGTEGREDRRRREGLVVSEHLLDVLVAVRDEHRQRLLVWQSPRRFQSLNRLLAAYPRQLGVRITNITGDGVVEGPEVLEVVEELLHALAPSRLLALI